MDTDLKDFIEANRATGKSRKLDRFSEQIKTLKDLGFGDGNVLRFLSKKKGVVVSQRTLTRFITRNKAKDQSQTPVTTADKAEKKRSRTHRTAAECTHQ